MVSANKLPLLMILLLLAACKDDPAPAPPVADCKATQWEMQHSPNMPDCVGDTWKFPSKDGVHYVVKKAGDIKQGQTVTLRFTITGDGVLTHSDKDDALPVQLKLYIQRKGDTLYLEDYRWWSVTPAPLTAGDHVLTVPLIPEQWSQVNGQNGATRGQQFNAAIENAARIGFTLGGRSFAGHGVFAKSGTVQFTVNAFDIH